MPQHSEELDIGLFQGRWSGRLALKHKVFPSLYLNELCICIVMGRSYFRAEEEEKMRFSDQIDPGSGALRNWQAASESLLFDQEPGSARRAQSAERRSRVWLSFGARRRVIGDVTARQSRVGQWPRIHSVIALQRRMLCFQRADIVSQTLAIYMAICRWHSIQVYI